MSGKSEPRSGGTAGSLNAAAKAIKPSAGRSTPTAAKPTKVMTPAPGGMAGGPEPPPGAKAAADRKLFAQQLATAKGKAERARAVSAKPVTAKQAFSKPAAKPTTPTFTKTAAKSRAKGAFKSAGAGKGRGGHGR